VCVSHIPSEHTVSQWLPWLSSVEGTTKDGGEEDMSALSGVEESSNDTHSSYEALPLAGDVLYIYILCVCVFVCVHEL
jgi:hypothetical protein